MATHIKVQGAKEIHRALLLLGQKEAKKLARTALRKAAKPILDAARANVPVKEGRLKRALRLKIDTLRSERDVMSALVYVSFSADKKYRPRKTDRRSRIKGKLTEPRYNYQIGSVPVVYGRFVEFGTVHVPARPFMRPAWDSQGDKVAFERLGGELGDGIAASFSQAVKR